MADSQPDEWRRSLGGALKWFPVEFPPTTGSAKGGDIPHQDGRLMLFHNGEVVIGDRLFERDVPIHLQRGDKATVEVERDALSNIVRIQTGSERRWYQFGFIEFGRVIELYWWDRRRRKYVYECHKPFRLYDDGAVGVGVPPNAVVYDDGQEISNHQIVEVDGDARDEFVITRQVGSRILEAVQAGRPSSPLYYQFDPSSRRWRPLLRWWSRGVFMPGASQDQHSGKQPPAQFTDYIKGGRVCSPSSDTGQKTQFTRRERERYRA